MGMTAYEALMKAFGASKNYTDKSIAGAGAIKGKNCTIQSIVSIEGGNRVTFKWTLDNGTVETDPMDVMDGLGIKSVDINSNNHLIVTYDDNTTHDAGEIKGGGSTVVVTPTLKSGTKIAEISVDGTPTKLYAPAGGGGGVSALVELSDIDLSTLSDGDVLVYDVQSEKWKNESPEDGTLVEAVLSKSVMPTASADYNGIPVLYIGSTSASYTKGHTYVCETSGGAYSWADVTPSGGTPQVTQFEVTTSGWTADTTSQSGSTLYKKAIALTQVDTEFPTVNIGSTGSLPTKVQQTAYDLLQYVTVDSTVPCLYLYASAIPTDAFYIKVEGVA